MLEIPEHIKQSAKLSAEHFKIAREHKQEIEEWLETHFGDNAKDETFREDFTYLIEQTKSSGIFLRVLKKHIKVWTEET